MSDVDQFIPRGDQNADVRGALQLFGNWVNRQTQQMRSSMDQAVAKINPDRIIQQALARVPNQTIPFKVDVVTTSKTVQVPNGANAVRVLVRAGAFEIGGYGENKYLVQLPATSQWVRISGERQAQITIGATGGKYYLGHSEVIIGNKKIRGFKTTYSDSNSANWKYEEANQLKGYLNTIHGVAVLEWFKTVPEGI